MSKISTSDFQKGIFIEFRGDISQIIEFQHVNPGKGSAFIRTKLKNIKTGNTVEFTYKSGETVEEISVNTREMQYLYKTDTDYIFMDSTNYEQLSVAKEIVARFGNYLKEGNTYQILVHDDKGIGLRIPKKVKLQVKDAEGGVKGNTVSGAKKTVTLETGVKVVVPLFIKKGDFIAVDPETGQYLERTVQE